MQDYLQHERDQPHSWKRLIFVPPAATNLHCFCPTDLLQLHEHKAEGTSLLQDCGIVSPAASRLLLDACGLSSSASLRLSSTSDGSSLGGEACLAGFFLGLAAFLALGGALLPALIALVVPAMHFTMSRNKQEALCAETPAGKLSRAHKSTSQGFEVQKKRKNLTSFGQPVCENKMEVLPGESTLSRICRRNASD